MRLSTLQAAVGSASIFLQPIHASAGHRHAHREFAKRHTHVVAEVSPVEDSVNVTKRSTCSLPTDSSDLFYVPGASNNGFAMSPDQPCTEGTYCPIACAPGKLMAQWQPDTKYVYPESMNGGLLCKNGKATKPFPDSPYCMDGEGSLKAVNNCGKSVAFCQTVLPGNEAMLIPTNVGGTATLAVPGPSYWAGTAAHYYINPPGVSTTEGCVWGDSSKPWGNWSPYVAGANMDSAGLTYVKIAYNPIWTASSLVSSPPTFGVKIECPNGGCNGLPCSINPATDGVGVVNSPGSTVGVGGASFCVVTVPKGGSANIVVFNTDGSSGTVSSSSSSAAQPTTSKAPTTSSVVPTTSSAATTSSAITSSTTSSSLAQSSSSSVPATSSGLGAIFHENSTVSSATLSSSSTLTTAATLGGTSTTNAPASTTSKSGAAGVEEGGSAVAGLIVAFVAAAALI